MISEQPQGAVLRLGKVIKVHPSDHSVDLVMLDNGAKMANVQLLSPTASTRSGRVDLPEPELPDPSKPWSPKMSGKQDLLAAVAMMGGTPICLGFLYPQVNELAMEEDTKNLAIERHASDFYTVTTDTAVKTMCHPGGAYLSFGGAYYNMGHRDDGTTTASAAPPETPPPQENAAASPTNVVSLPDRTTQDWGKVAIFAAHFDDEMIFMEPFVTDQIGAIYTCMYRYDANYLALREAIYPNIQSRVRSIWNDSDVGKYLDPSITGAFDSSDLNARDAFFLDGDLLKNRIDQIIDGLTGIEHIVTHNPWGEYGHAHHIWVFSFVYEACQRNKINLWCGDFYRICPHKQSAPFTTIAQAQLYRLSYSYWTIGFNSMPNAEARFQHYYQIMRSHMITGSTSADYWTWSNLINESVIDSYGTVLPPRDNVYFQLSGVVPEGSGTAHDGEYYSLLDPAGAFGDSATCVAVRKIIREAYRTLRDNFPVAGQKFFNGNRSTALISKLLDEDEDGDGGGYDGIKHNGGGFDKNWVIQRNINPVTVKIHSPDAFKNPNNSSDFSCAPQNATVASRSKANSATVIARSNGNIDAMATQNITLDADQSVTARAGASIAVKAGGTITASAGDSITVKAGGSITLQTDGLTSGLFAAIFLN